MPDAMMIAAWAALLGDRLLWGVLPEGGAMTESDVDMSTGDAVPIGGRRRLLGKAALAATAGALGGVLARAGDAQAQEPPMQFGTAIVPPGTDEVTIRGLTLTAQSIGLATSQSAQGTSCWIVLDPRLGTATITLAKKAGADVPVGFLILG